MCNGIYSFICKHELINTNQFGFRFKHSTRNYLEISSYGKACKPTVNHEFTDTVNQEILLEKLNYYGIRIKQNDYFYLFL